MKTTRDFINELIDYYKVNTKNNIKITICDDYVNVVLMNKDIIINIYPYTDKRFSVLVIIKKNHPYAKFISNLTMSIDIEDGVIAYEDDYSSDFVDIKTYDNGKYLLKVILEMVKSYFKNEIEINIDNTISTVEETFMFYDETSECKENNTSNTVN